MPILSVEEAKIRYRQAVEAYNTAADEFDKVPEDLKLDLAWKCFRLHREYRSAYTDLFWAHMAQLPSPVPKGNQDE